MPSQNPFPAPADIYGFQTITRTCSETDQVWLYTGNFIKRLTLVNVNTIGLPLSFQLTYNSQDTVDGPLGLGFRHNYMINLAFTGDPVTHISYTASTGIQYGFLYNSDTDTWGPDGASYFFKGTLTQEGSNWYVTMPDGSYCEFNEDGVLLAMADNHGNESSMTYEDGVLTAITEPTGRPIQLSYTDGLLTGIADPRNNSVTLSYTDGLLTQVLFPSGCYSTYGWTYLSTYGQNMLTSRTDANGTYTYSYENTSGTATSGRLIGVSDAETPANTISYAYHQPTDTSPIIEYMGENGPNMVQNFIATVMTDALDNAWQYDFDSAGNMWRWFQPSLTGSPNQQLSHWRHFYWDNNQQLLYAAGGYPLTFQFDNGPAAGPRDCINNVFHRYAYDNDYGFNGNTDPNNETGDSQGLLLYEADETGLVTAYTYDDDQNVTSVYPGQAHLGVQGNWVGQYGADGYVLCNFLGNGTGQDLIMAPSYIDTGNITLTPAANVTISQENLLEAASYQGMADCRCLMSPTGPDRNIGFWSANGTFTVNLPFSGETGQSFNLSVYVNSVDQGYGGNTDGTSALMYAEQFGRDLTLTVQDSSSQQVFRITNSAPGWWVTFPVTMAPGGTLTLALSASGANLVSGSPDVRLSALAFDPYDSRRTVMTYTEQNDLATMTDALNNTTSLTYLSNGLLSTITNPRNATTRLFYEDAAQNLTRIVDALENVEQRAYDENGNVIQIIDARNNPWLRTFDEQNRILTATNPLQSVRSWSYEGPNLVTVTDENNHSTNMTYTACGRLWTITDAMSGVVTATYSAGGNIVGVEDPNTNITGFSLDALMRVVTLTRPDGNTVTYGWDALDRLRAVTPPNGNVPSDSLSSVITTNGGNLLSNPGAEVVNPFNSAQAQSWQGTNWERDSSEHASGLASFKLTGSSSSDITQLAVSVPPGIRTLVTYQAMSNATSGNVTFTASILPPPVNGNTSMAYTVTGASWNLGVYNTWESAPPVRLDVPGDGQYDRFPVSNLTLQSSNQRSTAAWLDNVSMCSLSQSMAYDGAGRVVQTQAPDGSLVTRVRDRFGRVVGILDGRGQKTAITYDSLDRILTVTTPLLETMAWTYDSVGNVLTFEDANNNTTSYTTDLLNRLTAITYSDTTQELFEYDPVSNIVQYTDNKGEVRTLAFDPANRLRLVTYQVDSTTVSLTPDRVGNIIFRTDRNGDVTHQQFDALNRLVYVERNPGGVFSPGSSWMQSNSYDSNSNRTEFCNLLPGSYPQYDIAQYDIAEEPAPLPQWQPPASGDEYNSLNQLLAFRDGGGHATGLAYDSIESRLSTVSCSNGVSTGLTYDILGRVVAMTTALGATTLLALAYSYDLNSNRTGAATLGDGWDYGMDTDNRLVQEDLNRFVQCSADRFAAGSGTQTDTTGGTVAMLAFADMLQASALDLDRWRLSYSGPNVAFMGFEIRQDNDGLHLSYPRGYNNQTSYFDANVLVKPPYCEYGIMPSLVWGGCEHRTQMTGDFSIQVEFSDVQLQPTGFPNQSLALLIADAPMETSVPTPANALQVQINSTPQYQVVVTVGGSTTYSGTFSTTNTAGGLRIARSGSTVTFSTLVDGVWTALDTGTLTFSLGSPLYVMLVGAAHSGVLAGSFSNFTSNTSPAAYPTSSVFTSSLYDAGPDLAGGNPTWNSITWQASTPGSSSVKFQVYVGDNGDPSQAVYVGPDGTTGTYFTTSGTSLASGTTGRYASYRAFLSGDGTATAEITRVDVLYNTGSTNGSAHYTYGFDAASNMTLRVVEAAGQPTVTETRTFNDLNQITGNVVVSGNTTTNWTFTHDNNGNMLTKSNGTDTWSYQWNDENRLVLVTLPGGATVGYTWDAAGRMITRTDTTGTTYFVWYGQDCVQETLNGNVTFYYIPSGSGSAGKGAGLILSFDRNGTVYQVHGDALGSVRLVTGPGGTSLAQFDTDAWGNTLPSSFDNVPDGGFPYRWVGTLGVRYDAGTGLYWMRQRWYDAQLGRFIGRDPIRTRTNLYRYSVHPATYIDPFGRRFAWGPGITPQEQDWLNAALADIQGCPGGTIAADITAMRDDPSFTVTIQMVNPGDTVLTGGAAALPLGTSFTNHVRIGLLRNNGVQRYAYTQTLAHELYHARLIWKNRHHVDCKDSQWEEVNAEDYGWNVAARAISAHGDQWNIRGWNSNEPIVDDHLTKWFSGDQSNAIKSKHWSLLMGPSPFYPKGSATYLAKPPYPTDGTTFDSWQNNPKCNDPGLQWIFNSGNLQ